MTEQIGRNMGLTKKRYEAIAEILKINDSKKDIVVGLINYFKAENKNFKEHLFYRSVYK
jgi:hypothetical protein